MTTFFPPNDFRLYTKHVVGAATYALLEPQGHGWSRLMKFCTASMFNIRLYAWICIEVSGQNTTWSSFLGSYKI